MSTSTSTSTSNATTTPAQEQSSSSSSSSFLGGLLSAKTPGVKNIEAAYSRAGAFNDHTPGYASKLGSQDQGSQQRQGVGSKGFNEGIQDQRVEPSMIGKVFNNMINGTDKTK